MQGNPSGSTDAVDFKDRPRRWFLAGLAGLVLLLVAAAAALPAYRAVKARHGRNLALRGLEQLASGNYDGATETVRLALRFAPTAPEALRLAGRLLTQRPSPDGIAYWQAVLASGKATREDHSGYCRLLIALRRFDLLKRELSALMEQDPDDIEALEMTAGLLQAEGHVEQAINIARLARNAAPERRPLQLLLGGMLGARTELSDVREGAALLWDLALRDCPERREAIRLLANWRVIAPTEADLLARLLSEEFPDTTANGLLRIQLQDRAGRFPDAAARRAAARQLLLRAGQTSDRVLLADWFLAEGDPETALRAADEETSRNDGNLLQRRLQALATLKRWDEITTLLEDPASPLGPVGRNLFLASFDAARGRTNDVPVHLKTASAAAGGDPTATSLVARYSEMLGHHDIAAESLQALLGNPSLAPTVARQLLDLYRYVDNEAPIIATLERLRQFTPDNEQMLNELTWMQLIAGMDLPATSRVAAELAGRHPDNPRFAATVALAHLRNRDPDAALVATEPFPVTPEADLHLRIVRCAALGAAGQRTAARQIAATLGRGQLRPREHELVRPWLAPMPGAEPPPTDRH